MGYYQDFQNVAITWLHPYSLNASTGYFSASWNSNFNIDLNECKLLLMEFILTFEKLHTTISDKGMTISL